MKKLFGLLFSVFFMLTINAAKFDIPLNLFDSGFSNKIALDKAVVDTESRYISIYMTVDKSWIEKLDDLNLEALNRFYLNFLINKKIDFKGIAFFVRTNNLEAYQHILKFLPVLPPVPKKEGESAPQTKSLVPEKKYGNIEGGLTGKTIFTSPGHGWVYDTDNGTWNT
ncbi:MAG TPA: hypothetical protein PLX56_03700, partial [bacterium]|nr:hypothetical protein [bacterium]